MASDHRRRPSTTEAGVPIPAPQSTSEQSYSDVARTVFDKLRYGSKKSSTQRSRDYDIPVAPTIGPVSSQTTSLDTGLKIRALDINQDRSHVVLAGGKILRTVKVGTAQSHTACHDDFDIHNAAENFSDSSTPKSSFQSNDSVQEIAEDPASVQKEIFDVEDVAWSNGIYKNYIATAASNGKIMLYSMERPGVRIARLHEHYRQVHKVDFNPMEGAFLLSGSQDGTVRLWDMRNPRRDVMLSQSKETFPGRSDGVRHVKWSPRNTWTFAFATDSGTIQRWDTRNNSAPVLKISGHYETCQSIDWHADGKHLVSAGKDQNVRVWNMAPESRRQKPAFSFRAPKEVQNVRWRLPCLASDLNENTVKQCTQLATSYRRFPVVHVWDLRRPNLPFREVFHDKNTGTTDMLWRTTDLLWTVGPDGVFTQTDIPFAPKTLDRRSLSAFASSASSDLVFYTEARPFSRNFQYSIQHGKVSESEQQHSESPEKVIYGRSPGDDSFDEQFVISSSGKRPSRRSSTKSVKSVSGTPPVSEDIGKANTRDLDHTMRVYDDFKPHQIPKHGYLPGCETSPVFNYLAQKYKLSQFSAEPNVELFLNLRSIFEQNASYVELASRYRDAQTWKILGRQVSQEFRRRAEVNRKVRISKARRTTEVKETTEDHALDNYKLGEGKQRRKLARLSRSEILDSNGHESSSAAPTPIAKPYNASTADYVNGSALERAVDDSVQLPPSLLSRDLKSHSDSAAASHTKNVASSAQEKQSSAWEEASSKADEQRALLNQWRAPPKTTLNLEPPLPRSDNINVPPRFDRQQSSDSFMLFSASSGSQQRISAAESFVSDLPNAARTIDSAQESRSNASSFQDGDSYEVSSSPKGVMFSRQDSDAMSQLYDSSPEQTRKVEINSKYRQDSNRAANKDGSGDSLESQSSHVDVFPHIDELKLDENETSTGFYGSGKPKKGIEDSARTEREEISNRGNLNPQESQHRRFQDQKVVEQHQGKQQFKPDNAEGGDVDRFVDPEEFILSDFMSGVEDPPSELVNATDMLRQLLIWYTSHSDAQIASHLYITSSSLLVTRHAFNNARKNAEISTLDSGFIECLSNTMSFTAEDAARIISTSHRALHDSRISPAWIESILTTYHEHLVTLNLFNPATLLRRFAYPAFPGVYEQSVKDVQLGLLCQGCKTPINNHMTKMRCETCTRRQAPCSICDCATSPFSLPDKSTVASTKAKKHASAPANTSLWTACLLCNHATHAACAATWFADRDAGGACPVAGCLCDCAPGFYRKQRLTARAEAIERQRRRAVAARRDDWAVGESRAVGRVRGALRSSAAASAGGRSGPASATGSDTEREREVRGEEGKRVRVVAPDGD